MPVTSTLSARRDRRVSQISGGSGFAGGVTLLATGSDTRTMARQLSLSELTVQDHLKSIFAKTGVRDRVTLLSRALGIWR
jgi:Bacterial regulatory proteins, luxR family